MFSLPIAIALTARAYENGGFTYRVADNTHPPDGFAVGLLGYERKLQHLRSGDIQDFMTQHAEAFASGEVCLGAWHDGREWYLDISLVVRSLDQAIRVARANKQVAVFSLGDLETVALDNAPGVVRMGT